jgi:hypothetical protein
MLVLRTYPDMELEAIEQREGEVLNHLDGRVKRAVTWVI